MNELIYFMKEKMGIPFHSAGLSKSSNISGGVIWQIISDVPGENIGYGSNFSRIRVQFDIYSVLEREVFDICERLEKEVMGLGIVLLRSGPFFNADTKLYRRTVDVSFFRKGK